ncbi:hypothetical protein L226DRAFT_616645 [Lentinus tigrinus ALCF2SS1-7]|uniref:Uncharacterized protein n=1 Tax=Lentinus tigrinus ALCF2SS1-6 TaxID=1328759 RepID=A0A5C2RUY5_9APHY|nr:hypothetical protein L227DRAFT_615676 [Lentinus tigrinus ALCF2SS1-6]RPD69714.1 hypothetical protein L226DRAFT_616645 [Lentinus tigrinus ALCF2SS1-7]
MHPYTPAPHFYPPPLPAPMPYTQLVPIYSYYPYAYPHYYPAWTPPPYPIPVPHYVYVPPPASAAAPPPAPSPQPLPVFHQVQNYGSPAPPSMPYSQAQLEIKTPIQTSVKPPSVLHTPGNPTEDDIDSALNRAGIEDHLKHRVLEAKRRLAKISQGPDARWGPRQAVAEAILQPDNIVFETGPTSSEAEMLERWNQIEFYLGPRDVSTHCQGTKPKKRSSRGGKLPIDRASLRQRLLKYKCQLELNERSRGLDLPEVCDARPVSIKDGINRSFPRPGYSRYKPSSLREEISPMKKRPEQRRGSLLNPSRGA